MANLVTINGWVVNPLPSGFTGSWEPLVNSARNAAGNMIGDLINTKIKLELTWKMLTASQLATLRTYTDNFFVTVTYIDTKTNASRTMNCYTSPVSWSTFKYSIASGQVEYYNDVRVALIEK